MQITKKFIVAGAGVVTLIAGGGAAFAATATSTAAAPKVTAERAIQIAHEAVPGAWVSEADYDRRGTRPDVWEVELVKDSQRHEVDVDAATGKVTKHETGRDDHGGRDDDHGHDD
ncbi:PepSY domain-containing protein [Nonomuraea sp. NPDC049784]|uniref:PepSY domain-containing protein n=1 Tax=Nonomuraea sp. NPDC049784 TaxID=3154361 RepID=UPI0033FC4CD5